MRLRIKYQILLIAMVPVFLIDVFFTFVHINSSIKQAEELLNSKGEIIAQQIAGAEEFNLLSGNFEQTRKLLEQSINKNHIIFLAVYDTEGNAIARVEGKNYNSDLSTEYSYFRQSIQTENIDYEDIFQPDVNIEETPLRHLGWVHMYISKQQLRQNKRRIFNEGAIFFCTLLIISIFLTLGISRRLTRPIYTLLQHLKQVETGKLGEIIDDIEGNEIGDVQNGFNSMSQALLANRMQLDQKIKTATLDLMNAITDLEYKNRELAIARDNAQQADQVKTRFLANMSHEIRTPINGIKGFLNLLSNTGLNHDQVRYANIITQSTSDLSNIVNEILDFSKIESGNVELVESQFDLYELVESTRDSQFANALEKNIDLFLTIYSDTPRCLVGDKMRLKQILLNLTGNAIKFTDHGYVSITVMIENETEQQMTIRFNIKDSGIGISAHDQKSLFLAFKQIESDTNRRYSGTGLGLVISKNLANLMGGDISINSEIDSGSLFSVLIPFKLAPQEDPVTELIAEKTVMIYASNKYALTEIQALFNRINFNTETQLIQKTTNPQNLQSQLLQDMSYIDYVVVDLRHGLIHPDQFISQKVKDNCDLIVMHYDSSLIDRELYSEYQFISILNSSKHLLKLLENEESTVEISVPMTADIRNSNARNILIVDDNFINLELATELTRLWGHNPQQASNAHKAMQLFNANKFDIILLDIQMPEIDGVELMQMMRKEQPELATPIVAITANVMEKEKNRLLKLGFDAYISKPIDEQKFKALIGQEITLLETADQPAHSEDQDASIDFDLTLKLSANNEKLVGATFSMLQLEIPDYQDELNTAIETTDKEKIAVLMHKLQGVTCYAGLPRLKQLLTIYETEKNEVDDNQLLETISEINLELKNIDLAIKQYRQSEKSH